MYDWITTACALPADGDTVEFVLDERECPMRGIYALGRFESRWTRYAPTDVRQWRSTGPGGFGAWRGPAQYRVPPALASGASA